MRLYFDYAATTPIDPRVARAMEPYFSGIFGNPSSLHHFGQQALAALDTSRETIARILRADFREIIFTGSATEANNLAIKGSFLKFKKMYPAVKHPRLIVSSIEHESVLEAARDIEREGCEVVRLPVDQRGVVNLKKLSAELNDRTFLVSSMYANNEIGTIEPLRKIASCIKDFRMASSRNNAKEALYPLFHSDAVQAAQFIDCIPSELGLDFMTLSAHKLYGPKGVGVLYSRSTKSGEHLLEPVIVGGGQEFGVRSGTENVPLVVGFAKAFSLVSIGKKSHAARIRKLRDYLWEGLRAVLPGAELTVHSVAEIKGASLDFLPHILSIYISGYSAEQVVTRLDLAGIAISSGSACKSRAIQSSHVIEALGFTPDRAKHTIRFSLGRQTTQSQIDEAIRKIKRVLS